jgi:hypothetical protein
VKLAAACLLLTLGAAAAAPPAKTFGRIVKSSSKISPGADGPVFREGRLTVAREKTGEEEEFKATAKTKVTLDGKPAKFKAALPGIVILRASFDSKKVLTALDLKSAPRLDPAPSEPVLATGRVSGEVANTDALKGILSVRVGPGDTRDFTVSERSRIAGSSGAPLAFDAIKVGDGVEVQTPDGKSADEILVRVAP